MPRQTRRTVLTGLTASAVLRPQRALAAWPERNVTLMQSSLPCVPCGRAGCEDHRQSPSECLPGIEAGRLAAQALEMLAQAARK